MSESNNNTPMRITQLEEATSYPEGAYLPIAKAGYGTKKIDANAPNGSYIAEAKNQASGVSGFFGLGHFEHYGLNPDGSFMTTQKYRVSNNDPMTFNHDLKISVKDGFKWGYIPFDGSTAGTWAGWFTNSRTISANTSFVIQIARTVENTSEIADVLEFLSAITFENNTSRIKETSVQVFVSQNKDVRFVVDSSNNLTVNVATNRLFIFGNNASEVYHDYESNISLTVPNNNYAIMNLSNYELNVVSDLSAIYYDFVLLFKNHYGAVLGQWSRYAQNSTVKSLITYGARLVEPSSADAITIKAEGSTLKVNLAAARIFIYDYNNSTNPFQFVDLSNLNFTVNNSYVFCYNKAQKILDAPYVTTFTANPDNYIVLFYNNNGVPVGQWGKYWIQQKTKSNLEDIKRNYHFENGIFIYNRQGTVINNNVTYPENTIVAVKNAKECGYRAVRVTLRFTLDNVPVLCHDDKINSHATNEDGTAISSNIYIQQTNYEDLLNYDFGGNPRPSVFEGVKIATLADYAKTCANLDIIPLIEIPSDAQNNTQSNIENAIDIMNDYAIGRKTTWFISGTTNADIVHSYMPCADICITSTKATIANIDTALNYKDVNNQVGVTVTEADQVTKESFEYAHRKGVKIYAGLVTNVAGITTRIEQGFDGIEVLYVTFPDYSAYKNNIS